MEPKLNQEIILTAEQEKQILELWNQNPQAPPGLKELTKAVFGGTFDGRAFEGRAIKNFLVKCNLNPITTKYIPKDTTITLSEEHRQYITNNAATMNSLEMTRLLFNNNNLANTSPETRAVNNFVNTLDTRVIFGREANQDIPSEKYEPPNTFEAVLKRVNKYVNFILKKDKLNGQQKKGLETLINYLHTHRFRRQMDDWDSEQDRTTFEDVFVRCTYDKPDLTQEEVDQYIEFANQTVQGIKTTHRKDLLENRLAQSVGNDEQTMKISMSLVEAIGKASTEYDQCMDRQKKLLESLKQKRSDRLSKQIKENASILNLVQLWRDEEQRIKLIKLGELEQIAIAKEVEKLTNMAEIKAKILGLDKDSILLG